MQCILCASETLHYHKEKTKDYFQCENCYAVMLHPNNYVSEQEEITRYQTHNNDVENKGYQGFVQPIVKNVLSDFKPIHTGLDFGCGTGPVITKLLRDKNFQLTTYDPFFDNNKTALKNTYNYIACCEVIEHFHNPLKEFQLLKSLLKPNGKLYCMTDIFYNTINFSKWYYKNDETHVFFYHPKTFEWIRNKFNFSKVTIQNRLIIFEN